MSWRGNVMLAVALALLAGVYFGLQWRGEETAREAQQAKRLFDFAAADVTRLEIKQIEQPAVVAVREGEGWKLEAPNPTIPPFNPLWDRVAQHLAELNNQRSLDQGKLELAQYGLDIPALEVKATAAGREIALAFGKLEPTQEKRYAMLDGQQLFLVHKNEFFELNRSLEDLRNKFTVDDREANILRVEFAQVWQGGESKLDNPPAVGEESPPIVVARESKERPWRLTEPVDAAANQELVEAIVKELQFAVGRKFVDNVQSLSDYGLQPPRFRLTMVDDKSGAPQTFLFGNHEAESGGLYVQRVGRDGVFVMDPQILELLPHTPDEFQERRLLTQQALDFDHMVITHQGNRCELRDEAGKGWRVQSDESFDTDQAAVSTYITALKRAAGQKIIRAEAQEVGLAEPETLIQMYPKGVGEPAEIRLQSQWNEEGFVVAQQDLGAIMTLPVTVANVLQVDCTWFRSRKLWQPNATAAVEMALSFEGVAYHLKKAHGVWAVLQPENLKLGDNAAMEAYLKQLAELRVVSPRAELEGPGMFFGFESPTLAVTLTEQEEENAPTRVLGPLEVGQVTPDKMTNRYVRLTGQPGVYRVEQKLVDATREFISALQPK